MTRQIAMTGLMLLTLTLEGLAQNKATTNNAEEQNIDAYVALLRQDVKSQKVAIISEMMNFTPEEAAKFWPVYSKYSKELQQNR